MSEAGARSIALAEGEQFYQGRPCKLGHTLRYTNSYQCVTCRRAIYKYRTVYNKAYQAYWRAKNPDKVRAMRKRHYEKTKTREKARVRLNVYRAKRNYTLQILRDDGYRL